jgi:putative membrane-bound dehydrogenase-like protein
MPAEPVDYNQPQTPAKPTPAWVKMVDLGQQAPRLKGYQAPEGIKVEIVAENPVVINPVGMTFGTDGTPYVLEWRPDADGNAKEVKERIIYRDGSTREIATMRKQVKDVVKTLRDTKGNGTYDEAKVVLEEELPSSILIHDGWLYVSGRGTVRRYRQSKSGGPYDVKEVIAKGFCGFAQHQVSGLTIGPDGWLYITSGDDDNVVESSDGSRATALRTGAIFRCRPDGSRLHLFSQGFRNPYRDVAFDAAGNMFHIDNANEDGSKFMGCRLVHVAEGNDFGWRLRNGAHCGAPDPVRGAAFGELPGTVPPLVKTGRGAPAGLLIYDDTRLPDSYRGLLYYPDVLRRLIRAYRVQAVGAGFEVVEEFELLKTNDPLFRPCQMVVGPDGAIYVVDSRTDSDKAGRLWGDGKNGRIYRLSWSGAGDDKALPLRSMDSWEKISKQTQQELIQSLSSEDGSIRHVAQKTLRLGDASARAALLRLVKDSEAPDQARLAALGVLPTFWNAEVQTVCEELLSKGDSDLRRLCAQTLGLNVPAGDKEVQATLLKALVDQDPSVRRAVALAMGRLGGPGAADALVNTLASDDGKDTNLSDGLVRAIETLGKPGIDQLMSLAESGVAKDLDRVVETFARLRNRAAADAVPTLLKNPHLSIAQRAQVLASLNNYLLDPPLSLAPAIDYLLANPDEAAPVKLAGVQILSAADGPRSPRAVQWLLSLLTDADPDVRLAAIQAVGKGRIKQATAKLTEIAKEQDRPQPERTAASKALQSLQELTPRQ